MEDGTAWKAARAFIRQGFESSSLRYFLEGELSTGARAGLENQWSRKRQAFNPSSFLQRVSQWCDDSRENM